MNPLRLSCAAFFVFLLTSAVLASEPSAKKPAAFFPETTYTFQGVMEGKDVIHDFIVRNKGNGVLKINKVKST